MVSPSEALFLFCLWKTFLWHTLFVYHLNLYNKVYKSLHIFHVFNILSRWEYDLKDTWPEVFGVSFTVNTTVLWTMASTKLQLCGTALLGVLHLCHLIQCANNAVIIDHFPGTECFLSVQQNSKRDTDQVKLKGSQLFYRSLYKITLC